MADFSESAELIEVEECRFNALNDRDVDTAADFYGSDFVHYHSHGRIDTKNDELESFRTRPRLTSRENLEVRLFGDTAVMTGLLHRRYEDAGFKQATPVHMMQVWLRRDGRWQQVAAHDFMLESSEH